MKNFIAKNHRLLFYGGWLFVSLVQAGFTELLDDEAYYWVYSKFPAWGYFDHPPMIAMMIKAGFAVFPNELGVRLVSVFLNVFSLLIIEKLIPDKKPKLFYGIAFSLAVLQVSGFVAAPDIPLIFFTALFFLVYKYFLVKPSVFNTLLFGMVMALLMYSKYHGVLIIFFVLISNPRLLTRYPIYLAGTFALLVFSPHIFWLWQHDWISIRYQLFESNVNPYKFSYTTDYLLGQLLLAGPIAGFILIPAAFIYRNSQNNLLEKALKFTLYGMYLFFFLSSFKGKVEANWTSAVLIPLIILSHGYLVINKKWQLVLFKTVPVTIFLVIIFRFAMIFDFIPVKAIKERFHSWGYWPALMKEKTKGLSVVWNNSYQRASKYWFYTGQVAYSLNYYHDRLNNYNYWPIENELLLKPVYNLDIYNVPAFDDSIKTSIGIIGFRYDLSFISFAKIKMVVNENNVIIKKGEKINLYCNIEMPDNYRQLLSTLDAVNFNCKIGIFSTDGWIRDIPVNLSPKKLSPLNHLVINFPLSLEKGNYYLRVALQWKDYPATHNSKKIKLEVR